MPECKVEDVMDRLERHLKLDERVDRLEDRMTVVEQCLKALEGMPSVLTDLRIIVEGRFGSLSTQSKVTWALLVIVITGLLTLVWAYLSK